MSGISGIALAFEAGDQEEIVSVQAGRDHAGLADGEAFCSDRKQGRDRNV